MLAAHLMRALTWGSAATVVATMAACGHMTPQDATWFRVVIGIAAIAAPIPMVASTPT